MKIGCCCCCCPSPRSSRPWWASSRPWSTCSTTGWWNSQRIQSTTAIIRKQKSIKRLASHERSRSRESIASLGEEEGDALQVSERSYGLAVCWLLVLARRCRNRALVRHANTCTKWSSLSLADQLAAISSWLSVSSSSSSRGVRDAVLARVCGAQGHVELAVDVREARGAHALVARHAVYTRAVVLAL